MIFDGAQYGDGSKMIPVKSVSSITLKWSKFVLRFIGMRPKKKAYSLLSSTEEMSELGSTWYSLFPEERSRRKGMLRLITAHLRIQVQVKKKSRKLQVISTMITTHRSRKPERATVRETSSSLSRLLSSSKSRFSSRNVARSDARTRSNHEVLEFR